MIEILLKNKEIICVKNPDEMLNHDLDFHVMQCIDYTDNEINWIEEKFGIDFTIMKYFEDIEISSHFLSNENQAAFHISIPFYDKTKNLVESPIFFIISSIGFFSSLVQKSIIILIRPIRISF